jgi:hypothetical protein
MWKAIAAGTVATLLVAGAAQAAEQPTYTWTGYGVGSGKCPTYKMTINVTTVGNEARGLFQQEDRPQRHFEVNMNPDKSFKTRAVVGNNNMIDVVGTLKEGAPTIMLDGYCLFEGPLVKK